jgi:lipoprotein-anchoring transpeptidase ErfK/SrfK
MTSTARIPKFSLAALVLLVALLAGLACDVPKAARKAGPRVAPPVITLSPAPDSTHARPDKGLVVRVAHGALGRVSAYAGGHRVAGRFTHSRARWRSAWALRPGTVYTVSVAATGPGGTVTEIGKFRTRPALRELSVADVVPKDGETVGVGMPIIVTFTAPVRGHRAKAAVERALEVRAERHVEGAWRWVGDTQVIYRTRTWWPSHQHVVFTAHLSGVRAGPGLYGTADHIMAFTVGRRQISTVSVPGHVMSVRRDGATVRRIPISAGRGTTWEYTTSSGVHLTMDKADPVRMISPHRVKGDPGYYDELIDDAVRISNSGEYIHAKNNLWAQGRYNVSHGCVNASPAQAAWFYASTLRGDPVIVTGTDRRLRWDNGWGYWQLTWDDWVTGSATDAGLR